MKWLFIILLSASLSAQKADSLVWFTPTEVQAIANRFRVLDYKLVLYDSLTYEYKQQIKDGARLVAIKDSIISKRDRQIRLLQDIESLNKKIEQQLRDEIEAMKPTVFESPLLWGLVGFTTGYLVFKK